MQSAVVGFDFSGDALLNGEPFMLYEGLTVLYGQNGAGKTRLLRGMRNALLGVHSEIMVSLVVRAIRPDEEEAKRAWGNVYGPEPNRPLLVALAQALASDEYLTRHLPTTPIAERALSMGEASNIVDQFIREEAAQDEALLAEILSTRLFLLSPTGTETSPSWDAWPVVDASLPEAARAWEALQSSFLRFDDLDDDEERAQDRFHEERRRAVIIHPEWHEFYSRSGHHLTPYGYLAYGSNGMPAVSPYGIAITGEVDLGIDTIDFERDAAVATREYLGLLAARLVDDNFDAAHFDNVPFTDVDGLSPAQRIIDVDAILREGVRASIGRSARSERLVDHVEDQIADVGEELSAAVNRTLAGVLLDAPQARLVIAHPVARLSGPPVYWDFARTSTGSSAVGMDDLSRAERMWAQRAILDALYWHERRHLSKPSPARQVLYMYDEPEAALHRAAEVHMASSIVEGAEAPRQVVVATHSPELLNTPLARVVEVRRGAGRSDVHLLDLADKEALHTLGLVPADLLRLTKIFVIVEGEHDEVLLKHFLGSRLRRARVELIAQHGAKKLPHTVESTVLFDHTEAKLVGLVDNELSERLETIWEEAKRVAKTDSVDRAVKEVVEAVGKETGEQQYVGAWLSRAIRKGVANRVYPAALEAADIVEYLPVERLVPGASSWEHLHETYAGYRADRSDGKSALAFKSWLEKTYKADFSPTSLRRAAAGLPVPLDMERLMKRLEALAAEQG